MDRISSPDRTVSTICPYCGVGCQLNIQVKGERIVRVAADPEGPANRGMFCVKGKFGLDFVHSPDRLKRPLIKRNGEFAEATWEEALDLVASRLSQYKGEQFAFMASAKCTNEENYLFQKFARGVMGTANVDHCARLCHSTSVTGLVATLGSGVMTNSIQEIGDAKCILAIGTNTTETHPVIAVPIWRAVSQGAKLIVANPREVYLCRWAHQWIRHRAGTDVALIGGMMRVILDEGLLDQEFIQERCENFEALRDSLSAFDLDTVEGITGVPREEIAEAARTYATSGASSILYAMGITQHSHGTDNVFALADLAMLTGNLGKPSSGINPLRGQNNMQGACDMGSLPDVYPGYQPVSNPEAREKFEAAWGCPLPQEPGLSLTEMFDAILEGQVKAMCLVGENPLITDPNASHVEEALKHLEFLVVQDIFLTETARLAHVVLPAATFAEKEGTFTNTERRVQMLRKVIEPLGDSRPDWWITCEMAKRLGGKGFEFHHPSEIMEEIASLTPSYGGISYGRLEEGGLQWPCPTPDHPGTPILHTERFTRGKGRFMPLEYRPSLEQPDEEYPLILTTGRSGYQYHSGTMSRRVEGLNILEGEELVRLNPQDAARMSISEGDLVEVTSRRGRVRAKARVTESSAPGELFMTFHFSEAVTNLVTNPGFDPIAKMPELKVCAVRVEKV